MNNLKLIHDNIRNKTNDYNNIGNILREILQDYNNEQLIYSQTDKVIFSLINEINDININKIKRKEKNKLKHNNFDPNKYSAQFIHMQFMENILMPNLRRIIKNRKIIYLRLEKIQKLNILKNIRSIVINKIDNLINNYQFYFNLIKKIKNEILALSLVFDDLNTTEKNKCVKSFNSDVCSICLEDLIDEYKINCGHSFHYDCIYQHMIFSRNPSCPLCRTIIE